MIEWGNCVDRAVIPNPFFEPASVLGAARWLDGERGARLLVVKGREGYSCCLPIEEITSRRGPLSLRVAHTRGLSTAVGLGTPILASDGIGTGMKGMVEELVRWARSGGPGVVVLDWLDDERDGVGVALKMACSELQVPWVTTRTWERPVVRRDENGLSLETAMSGKRRSEIRRRRRRLEEHLGGTIEVLDRAGSPEAVEDFLRLEASGWKGHDGDAYLLSDAKADWFRGLCAEYAEAGRLHLIALQSGGRCMAVQCHLRSGPESFLLRVAHDASLNSFGLGVLLHVSAVDLLGGLEVDLVDSCASPGDSFLADLYPGRRRLMTTVLGTGGPATRMAIRLAAMVREKK